MTQVTVQMPVVVGYYLDRLKEPSTWVSIALVASVLDQQGYLPQAWHSYILAGIAALAALGIHLPSTPAKPPANGGPKT